MSTSCATDLSETAVPVPAAAEPAAVGAETAADLPLRWVTADAVNVRQGPSTANPVIGRVTRGEAVTMVDEQAGWVRIRIEGDGVEGFVAARLLTDLDPAGG